MTEEQQFNVYFLCGTGLFFGLFFISIILVLRKFRQIMRDRDAYYEKALSQNGNTEVLSLISEVMGAVTNLTKSITR